MSLHLRELQIGYERHAICGPLNLHVPKGALIALLGPNGAGKSTLLRTLAGELRPFSGSFQGASHQTIAYLPQLSGLLANAPVNVRDVVTMGLWAKLGSFGKPCSHDLAAIDLAIDQVGLSDFAHVTIGELSGGQIQRALFARLAVQDCDVLLLDEPFTALDHDSQNDLLSIMKKWHQSGKTIIAAVHDQDVAGRFPQWLTVRDGSAKLSDNKVIEPVRGESGLRVITGGVA
jgi:zinc/manganese transport system ATP-binding protein